MKEIELTEMESLIWDKVRWSETMITAGDLAHIAEISSRNVRRIVLSLRLKGKLIGSTCGAPAGYYVIQNETEKFEFFKRMMRQIYANIRVINAVCGIPLSVINKLSPPADSIHTWKELVDQDYRNRRRDNERD